MKRFFLVCCALAFTTVLASAQNEGIGGLVKGKVQKVGFRAFVLRQAISQNLAGWTLNLPDGRVSFVLYGNPQRIALVLTEIEKGPERSTVSHVRTWGLFKQPQLSTFTVYGWTSETRNLHVPRDLVFQKRPDDSVLDEHETKKAYHAILKAAGVEDP